MSHKTVGGCGNGCTVVQEEVDAHQRVVRLVGGCGTVVGGVVRKEEEAHQRVL